MDSQLIQLVGGSLANINGTSSEVNGPSTSPQPENAMASPSDTASGTAASNVLTYEPASASPFTTTTQALSSSPMDHEVLPSISLNLPKDRKILPGVMIAAYRRISVPDTIGTSSSSSSTQMSAQTSQQPAPTFTSDTQMSSTNTDTTFSTATISVTGYARPVHTIVQPHTQPFSTSLPKPQKSSATLTPSSTATAIISPFSEPAQTTA